MALTWHKLKYDNSANPNLTDHFACAELFGNHSQVSQNHLKGWHLNERLHPDNTFEGDGVNFMLELYLFKDGASAEIALALDRSLMRVGGEPQQDLWLVTVGLASPGAIDAKAAYAAIKKQLNDLNTAANPKSYALCWKAKGKIKDEVESIMGLPAPLPYTPDGIASCMCNDSDAAGYCIEFTPEPRQPTNSKVPALPPYKHIKKYMEDNPRDFGIDPFIRVLPFKILR